MRASLLTLLLGLVLGAADEPAVTLRLAGCQKPVFGEVREYLLRFANGSDRIFLVRRIVPVTNAAEDTIVLHPAPNGLARPDGDGWIFGPASIGFEHSVDMGLLLPGEEILVRFLHRPLAGEEEFRVEGLVLPSTGAAFLPEGPPSPKWRFLPFTRERWAGLVARDDGVEEAVDPVGSDPPRRVVLVPEEAGTEPFVATATLRFGFAEPDFPLSAATAAAARLEPGSFRLTRSAVTGDGWTVLGAEASWLLRTPDQAERGELLPPIPPGLLKALDAGKNGVEVRVAAEPPETGEALWGKYPTRTGRGIHPERPCVDITPDRALGFLRDLGERGLRLVPHRVFHRVRYFELTR